MRSPLANVMAEPRLERMLAFNQERDAILADVTRRVVEVKIAAARKAGDVARGLELTLNDVCFHEDRRFRATRKLDAEDQALRGRFKRLSKGLRNMSESELSSSPILGG